MTLVPKRWILVSNLIGLIGLSLARIALFTNGETYSCQIPLQVLRYSISLHLRSNITTFGVKAKIAIMSYSSRPLGSHLRQQSMGGSLGSSSGQSPILQARINEKRAELENLKQLRDLSAGLAGQMQMLEEKLSTLSDGTEAVATVLGNWHNVLQAISMASSKS